MRRLVALAAAAALLAVPAAAAPRAPRDRAPAQSAQELANRTKHLSMPAHAAAVRPEAARFAQAATLDVDPAKFGPPEERQRLARRQRAIGDAAR
ncbi:MAG: hypothetical protein IPM22_14720 [Betaproteobacteria bacterium]|nr:hypothetical protein [Betaproteobacteria bacterium]